jgi:hypothetical protein
LAGVSEQPKRFLLGLPHDTRGAMLRRSVHLGRCGFDVDDVLVLCEHLYLGSESCRLICQLLPLGVRDAEGVLRLAQLQDQEHNHDDCADEQYEETDGHVRLRTSISGIHRTRSITDTS